MLSDNTASVLVYYTYIFPVFVSIALICNKITNSVFKGARRG